MPSKALRLSVRNKLFLSSTCTYTRGIVLYDACVVPVYAICTYVRSVYSYVQTCKTLVYKLGLTDNMWYLSHNLSKFVIKYRG